MDSKQSGNGLRRAVTMWATTIIAAMGTGGGSVYVYMRTMGPVQMQAMARPDPATGSEMRALGAEVRRHVDNHPDILNRFDRRITYNQAKIESLEATIERLERRLDRERE